MLDDEAVAAALMAEAKTEEMEPAWSRWAHINYSQEDGKYAEYPPYSMDPEANRVETLMAARGGLHPAELWLALNKEKNGLAKFYEPFANNLQDVMEAQLGSNWCLPGVGDTGAHLSIIIDAGWPSFVLKYWHRERGFYSLGEAVRRLTSAPAHAAAIHARGLLKVGMKADINIIDLDSVGEAIPHMVQDLPRSGFNGRILIYYQEILIYYQEILIYYQEILISYQEILISYQEILIFD